MPIYISSKSVTLSVAPDSKMRDPNLSDRHRSGAARNLKIGLVNNMPDSALDATERQFISLLTEAAEGISIDLALYALPGIPRSGMAARRVDEAYESTDSLLHARLDGMIVTGREPLSANLQDEPYWNSFIGLLDWARENTHSSIWSCLAAHAAVLHMDGIKRIRNHEKYCGALNCRRISSHPLNDGAPAHFHLPHSRWNGLPEDRLVELGYQLLSVTDNAGVDSFCKDEKSLFLFFQGHPEYESFTLLLEYRRDVNRYLTAESDIYPSIPRNYFDAETTARLTAIEQQARHHRSSGLLAELSETLEKAAIENSWRSMAICTYRNWLKYLITRREDEAGRGMRLDLLHTQESLQPDLVAVGDPLLPATSHAPSTAATDSRSTLTIL